MRVHCKTIRSCIAALWLLSNGYYHVMHVSLVIGANDPNETETEATPLRHFPLILGLQQYRQVIRAGNEPNLPSRETILPLFIYRDNFRSAAVGRGWSRRSRP